MAKPAKPRLGANLQWIENIAKEKLAAEVKPRAIQEPEEPEAPAAPAPESAGGTSSDSSAGPAGPGQVSPQAGQGAESPAAAPLPEHEAAEPSTAPEPSASRPAAKMETRPSRDGEATPEIPPSEEAGASKKVIPRLSLTLQPDLLEALRRYSYWERKTQTEIIEEMIVALTEGKNLPPIPRRKRR